jgi:hypothetical protein
MRVRQKVVDISGTGSVVNTLDIVTVEQLGSPFFLHFSPSTLLEHEHFGICEITKADGGLLTAPNSEVIVHIGRSVSHNTGTWTVGLKFADFLLVFLQTLTDVEANHLAKDDKVGRNRLFISVRSLSEDQTDQYSHIVAPRLDSDQTKGHVWRSAVSSQ